MVRKFAKVKMSEGSTPVSRSRQTLRADTSVVCEKEYLKVVKHPSVLEGSLAELSSLLLVLLDGSLVDTSALVDQVAGGGGLASIDVANDHKVDVNLFLSHGVCVKK